MNKENNTSNKKTVVPTKRLSLVFIISFVALLIAVSGGLYYWKIIRPDSIREYCWDIAYPSYLEQRNSMPEDISISFAKYEEYKKNGSLPKSYTEDELNDILIDDYEKCLTIRKLLRE